MFVMYWEKMTQEITILRKGVNLGSKNVKLLFQPQKSNNCFERYDCPFSDRVCGNHIHEDLIQEGVLRSRER